MDRRTGAAFTLLELLVVMAIILIVAGLLLPALGRAGAKGRQVACLGSLRQMGVGFHLFANDHGDRFPMQVSTNEGGSFEYNRFASNAVGLFAFTFRNFQVLSNELVTPQILVCRADPRTAASNFATLTDRQVSYFAGLQAAPSKPASVLSGDGNLTNAALARPTPAASLGEIDLGWTRALHDRRGNVLFADGHAELLRSLVRRRTAGLPATGPSPGGTVPGRVTPGGTGPGEPAPGTPSSTTTRSAASTTAGNGRASGTASLQPGSVVMSRGATPRDAAPKAEPDVAATNAVRSDSGYFVAIGTEAREEWDTDRFRFFSFLFKLTLLAYIIAGAILLVTYFLKKKKEQEAGLG